MGAEIMVPPCEIPSYSTADVGYRQGRERVIYMNDLGFRSSYTKDKERANGVAAPSGAPHRTRSKLELELLLDAKGEVDDEADDVQGYHADEGAHAPTPHDDRVADDERADGHADVLRERHEGVSRGDIGILDRVGRELPQDGGHGAANDTGKDGQRIVEHRVFKLEDQGGVDDRDEQADEQDPAMVVPLLGNPAGNGGA